MNECSHRKEEARRGGGNICNNSTRSVCVHTHIWLCTSVCVHVAIVSFLREEKGGGGGLRTGPRIVCLFACLVVFPASGGRTSVCVVDGGTREPRISKREGNAAIIQMSFIILMGFGNGGGGGGNGGAAAVDNFYGRSMQKFHYPSSSSRFEARRGRELQQQHSIFIFRRKRESAAIIPPSSV